MLLETAAVHIASLTVSHQSQTSSFLLHSYVVEMQPPKLLQQKQSKEETEIQHTRTGTSR